MIRKQRISLGPLNAKGGASERQTIKIDKKKARSADRARPSKPATVHVHVGSTNDARSNKAKSIRLRPSKLGPADKARPSEHS